MRVIFPLIALFMFSAHAQKPKVLVIDPDIDAKELEKTFTVERPAVPNSLPNKDDRDELLKGLAPAKKWDELKRDIFYMDLKSKSLSDLRKKYPEISEEELKKLKEKR